MFQGTRRGTFREEDGHRGTRGCRDDRTRLLPRRGRAFLGDQAFPRPKGGPGRDRGLGSPPRPPLRSPAPSQARAPRPFRPIRPRPLFRGFRIPQTRRGALRDARLAVGLASRAYPLRRQLALDRRRGREAAGMSAAIISLRRVKGADLSFFSWRRLAEFATS